MQIKHNNRAPPNERTREHIANAERKMGRIDEIGRGEKLNNWKYSQNEFMYSIHTLSAFTCGIFYAQ